MEVKVRSGFAASVVLASKGYPGSYEKGKAIDIGELPPGKHCLSKCMHFKLTIWYSSDVYAFHAGTQVKDGKVVTSGGRVLVVSAVAPSVKEAVDLAYAGVSKISFEGMVHRKDIAHRYLTL